MVRDWWEKKKRLVGKRVSGENGSSSLEISVS